MSTVRIPWTRLPMRFDPRPLQADLERIAPSAWVPHFNQQDYEGVWTSVALRSASGRTDDIQARGQTGEFSDTPVAAACPHLRSVVDAFEFPKKSVRLLRLAAGSRIREHRDLDLGLADGEIRIHVVVMSNDQVEFVVANRRLMLRPGEAWYIDFSQAHRIDNRGITDRTHLVIDGTSNEWMLALLERSVRDIVTETIEPDAVRSLREFRDLVFEDRALQLQLLAVSDPQTFIQAVVAAGAARGFDFHAAEVESACRCSRQEWFERAAGL